MLGVARRPIALGLRARLSDDALGGTHRRPLQADQACRVHRALSHAEDPSEALLDQCRGVPDLNADAGLLPGRTSPLGEDLRSQPVRWLVDQIPGQRRGLGQHQGPCQCLLALGGVGQGRDDGDALERGGLLRDRLLPGAVLVLRRAPGVGAQGGSVRDGGDLFLGERGQCQDGGIGPGQCSGGASGGPAQEAGLVVAQRGLVVSGDGERIGVGPSCSDADHEDRRGSLVALGGH